MSLYSAPMKTIVITGASDGIGASAARIIHNVRPEDRLVLVGRNAGKTEGIAKQLGAEWHVADFADLAQVQRLAGELAALDRIDVLANNAGGVFPGPVTTVDGFEKSWQVNVVAPYLLTNLLLPVLVESQASVVATSSVASLVFSKFDVDDPNTFDGFTADRAYGNAKLGNIFVTKELHRRYHAAGLNTVAFHPGVIATNFGQEDAGLLGRMYQSPVARMFARPGVGGENLAYFIAGVPGIHWESGRYYDDKRRLGRQKAIAKDLDVARRVFDDMGETLDVSWPSL
ncbi:SDR family NAD(P)-dependent oxidoreductase [uncultured Corynebacterium sp.]|uniref:SDR family NAD(P)-dependent oxidoreductase n=1 Tax=uncultured Corynebacterium sp. TaxID=159447 RepID=UPI0025FC0E4A|nr:SDR family NAD(P)-dependent oxidoreductase [uncultured Corynebacterium sp.]